MSNETDTKSAPHTPSDRAIGEAEGALFECLKVELATRESPSALIRCSDDLRAFYVAQSEYIANLTAAIASLRTARFAGQK